MEHHQNAVNYTDAVSPEVLNVLSIGGCAGSPYNIQPWRFGVSGNRIDVYLERYQGGLWELPLVYQATLGCLLENLIQGAQSAGYSSSYELISPNPGFERPMLELNLEPDETEIRPDVSHLRARYTNRKPYFPKPVPPEIIKEVQRRFSTEHAAVRDLGANEPFIRNLCRLEWVRGTHAGCGDEVHAHIRCNVREAERERDLLDVRVLEFNIVERTALQLCHWSKLMRRLLELSGGAYFVELYQRRLLMHTPSILVFHDRARDFSSVVHCWRRIQNVLNFLSLRGLSAQPVLAGLDILKLPAKEFTPRQQDVMRAVRGQLERMLGEKIDDIAAIVRVGYAEPCAVRSLRIEPKRLILREQSASADKRLRVL